MCEKCRGRGYQGVNILFNGDFQKCNGSAERSDWVVISPRIIVHLGESSLKLEDNAIFRGCEKAIASLTVEESIAISALSSSLDRPEYGKP